MKNNNYPNWLAPKDIAEKLKEIGFNKKCYFTILPRGVCGAATFDADHLGLQDANFEVSSMYGGYDLPFWSDVLEWFREKGLHCYIEATRTSIEYIDKNLKSPTIFNGKPFKKPNMMQPITLYSYYTSTNAKGSCMFELDNFNLTINTQKFKTYEECRYAMIIDLIEEYKKCHMNNENSN